MKFRVSLICCIVSLWAWALPYPSLAQSKGSGVVSGQLVDGSTGEPVIGAVVECAPADKPDQKTYATTAVSGQFSLPTLAFGDYLLKVTYLGMKPYTASVKIDKKQVQLGRLAMQPDVKQLGETVVEAVAMRTTQKGDTVVYNAGSYKVTQDASTDELLAKMPGIKVDGGTVEAHGEEVKKVLIDGKEFFGDDVTTAIKNLPAEVIDKIEVFDKKSDQAEFSGVDDGEDYKAINIVTRDGVDRAKFGKFAASYGFDDLYNVGLNLSLFKGSRRLTFLGMVNNVNQQNFAIDDLLGVMNGGGGGRGAGNFLIGNQSGISTVRSVGVNYSNEWREKLKLSASYFFNSSDNMTEALTDRDYFIGQQYHDIGVSRTRNFNHRLNARIEYKIDSNNTLMFRPTLRFQTHDVSSSDTSATLAGGGRCRRDDPELSEKPFQQSVHRLQPVGQSDLDAPFRRSARPCAGCLVSGRSVEKRSRQRSLFADALFRSRLDVPTRPIYRQLFERIQSERPVVLFRACERPRSAVAEL